MHSCKYFAHAFRVDHRDGVFVRFDDGNLQLWGSQLDYLFLIFRLVQMILQLPKRSWLSVALLQRHRKLSSLFLVAF